MQRSRITDAPPHAGARTTPILVAVLLFCLSLTLAPAISAQDSTPESDAPVEATPATVVATPAAAATPQAAAVDTLGTVLMTYDFEDLPPAPLTVRLLRITLAPGASVPMHTHPGPEFNLVESGTLSAGIDGTAFIGTVGGTPEVTEVTEDQTLGVGQWIMYPAGTGMNLANEGEEELVLLAAVIQPVGADVESTITYANGQPTEEDLQGVSFVVLGDGLIQQFPAGGATVTVDQLVVAAGEPVPGFSGPALLSKTSGAFAISAGEGQVQVTRTATPQLQPNAIPGQEFTLADNDAAFFPAGYEAIPRPESTDELILTRLLIQPQGDLASAPALVTAIQAATTETVEDVMTDDGLGVGAIVALNEDAVRVRAEATTTSDIVESFPLGTQFEIVGGPVEGEDFTWYQVVGVGDLSDIEGWLTTDFIDVIEPAPASAEQQSDDGSSGSEEVAETADTESLENVLAEESDGAAETADTAALEEALADLEASPAVAADIPVGSIVATTEDNLRIRSDASTAGDIIIAVATGTQLEVIGGPVEAENFTWYEVQVVDGDASGWVASDFLEVVEPASE